MQTDIMFGMLSANGYIQSRTQTCYENALVYLARERNLNGRSKYRLRKSVDKATNVFAGRNWHCQYTLDYNCDYLMIIDSDMTFPEDAVKRLLDQDKDIISGLAFTKSAPYNPVMGVKENPDRKFCSYKTVVNWVDNSLIKVEGIGTAFLLIKRKVLETIEPPWFCHIPNLDAVKLHQLDQILKRLRYDKGVNVKDVLAEYDTVIDAEYDAEVERRESKQNNDQEYRGPAIIGSDYYFCNKAVDAGFEIWVDTSVKLGHIGEADYDIEDYKSWGGPIKPKSTQEDVSTDYDTVGEFARKSHDTRRTA